MSAFGIFYLATDIVYVATDCGLLWNESLGNANWMQTSNWTNLYPVGLMSVHAGFSFTGTGNPIVIDVCRQGGGQDRSVDSGKTWRGVSSGPDCNSSHSLTGSPVDLNILFATAGWGGTVLESHDGGSTWPIDLHAPGSERPAFVESRMSPDKDPSHFVIYYSGFYTGCLTSATDQNCPTNVWHQLPDGHLDHDVNEIAFDPNPGASNCAVFEVSDFGVLKRGPATAELPCGDPSAWTLPSSPGSPLGALQIYELAGQVQYPITGSGVYISGHTSLFIGTMDNLLWETYDAGTGPWQCLGPPSCEPEGSFLQVAPPVNLATEVTFDSLFTGERKKLQLNQVNGALSNETDWTTVNPPGNGSDPYYVSPNTYVEWSAGTLYLTQDSGASWIPVGSLPSTFCDKPVNLTAFIDGHSAVQVANTLGGLGPVVYAMVADSKGNQGIAILPHFLPPPSSPGVFEVQTLGGTNDRCFQSHLAAIWGNCFGQGSYYCAPIFAADANDYRHLYASDSVQKVVMGSTTAGVTWTEDIALTNLITSAGASMTDSTGNSQVHAFAFDPANSSHILVGTDQAGIFASANGGLTWSALPNTAKATAITSFFFDDRTNAIFVATYGRGLWKLTLDWTTVH